LTGGEPFFYKSNSINKNVYKIYDLIDYINKKLSNTLIIIKTSGWSKNKTLDNRLKKVYEKSNNNVDIRFGFNLFQDDGNNLNERLSHMIESILSYQNTLRIETIYNKSNFKNTLLTIQKSINQISSKKFNFTNLNPNEIHRLEFNFNIISGKNIFNKNRTIRLDIRPAHSGLNGSNSEYFCDSYIESCCSTIKNGADNILYNANLSFYHCNDAFVNHKLEPFSKNSFNTINEEINFLNDRFSDLNNHIISRNITFNNKKEQCDFCSEFILNSY